MERFGPLLYLLLGWLLGLLGPTIVDRIKRSYRVADVTKAIVLELEELRYDMALYAYLLCRPTGSLSDEWLDWIEPIIRDYRGPWINLGSSWESAPSVLSRLNSG